ncbi:unnamed protein product [Adineta ricciae]|uniref:Uncharacterized protein n=1 Tax=Adineta ricciae TaxID=249248 RepID=A0A815ASX7_ADIRI|nr:unnamed protein product [Adineta ricciae]
MSVYTFLEAHQRLQRQHQHQQHHPHQAALQQQVQHQLHQQLQQHLQQALHQQAHQQQAQQLQRQLENVTDPINWPLIGTIIGVLSLFALTVICFCCCRYCCVLGNRLYGFKEDGNNELYHIDLCTDPNCYWTNISISSSAFTLSGDKHNRYRILNESPISRTTLSSSLSNTKDCLVEDADETELVDFRADSFLSMTEDRPISNVSVQKVKYNERSNGSGNIHIIKSPLRPSSNEKEKLPTENCTSAGSVKVFRVKSLVPLKMSKTNDPKEGTASKPQSVDTVRITHVNNLLLQRSADPLVDQKLNNSSNNEPIHSSANPKKDNVIITRVLADQSLKEPHSSPSSAIRTIIAPPTMSPTTISVSSASNKPENQSRNVVRVDRLPTERQNSDLHGASTSKTSISPVSNKPKVDSASSTRVIHVLSETPKTNSRKSNDFWMTNLSISPLSDKPNSATKNPVRIEHVSIEKETDNKQKHTDANVLNNSTVQQKKKQQQQKNRVESGVSVERVQRIDVEKSPSNI